MIIRRSSASDFCPTSAAHGDVLLRHLFPVERSRDVCKRADVADHRADVEREAAGGNDLSRDLVDDLLLVAGRIVGLEQVQLHAVGLLEHFLQGTHGSLIMCL